jgi:hypothetical protein
MKYVRSRIGTRLADEQLEGRERVATGGIELGIERLQKQQQCKLPH